MTPIQQLINIVGHGAQGLDWKSFVNGWLEGRLDLIENREK